MPLHPAPPQELPDLVEGYRQAMRSLIDLARSCSSEQLDAATACAGWSVRDHLAHVASLEAYLEGGAYPQVPLPPSAHLRNEVGTWMEHGVQVRRARPVEEVLLELETLLEHRMSTLSDPELTLQTPVRAPLDRELPLGALMDRRLVDLWVHEQDIREAVDRFGNLDSPAASVFVARVQRLLPRLVRERMQVPAGHSVILDVTGPVTARFGVRMVHGQGAEVVPHPLFTGDSEAAEGDHADQLGHPDDDVASTTIILSTDALTRRAAGRRSTDDTAYRVVGDDRIAHDVLDALVVTV